jgi:glutamyl-tRNA(Gln) amidotransferase subunit E
MDSEYTELFETIAKENKVSPTTIAVFLTETMKALKREGVQIEKISESQIKEIFKCIGSGELTREALQDVVIWLSKHEGQSPRKAIENLGLKTLSREELEGIINNAISCNKDLIEKSGEKAFGSIMGMVMREVRGRAKAELVSELIKKKLEQTKT